jgi:hypothetical protein
MWVKDVSSIQSTFDTQGDAMAKEQTCCQPGDNKVEVPVLL